MRLAGLGEVEGNAQKAVPSDGNRLLVGLLSG